MMKDIAETINTEPVDFQVTVANPGILHRLKLRKTIKTFIIYPTCLGTLLQIAKIISSVERLNTKPENNETFLESSIKNIINNAKLISEVIGLSIWNRKYSENSFIRFFQKMRVRSISRYIERNLDSYETFTIMKLVVDQMEIQHFLAIMVTMKGLIVIPEHVTEKKQEEKSSGQ